MGLVPKRRGQVSLEFMLVLSIMLIMLLYSIKNVSFDESSPSSETLAVQIALEEKNLADAISGTISQVYAQGPGSKATAYARLVYLRNPKYLEKGLNVVSPRIFITYGPYLSEGNGTYVAVVNGTGTSQLIRSGENKNAFWSRAMYQEDLSVNPSVWSSGVTLTWADDGTTAHGLNLDPSTLPPELRIVVEWNPNRGDSWLYNATAGELRININPGE